jgi:hypothetical protein
MMGQKEQSTNQYAEEIKIEDNYQDEESEEQKNLRIVEKNALRYANEKRLLLNQGAEEDPKNGSILRKAKRSDKIGAQGRTGNIALDVDRPVLPIMTFS